MLADKLKSDPIWPVAFTAGIACVEAGVWVSFGIGWTLMLNGAVLLYGCWKTA